MEFWDIYNSNKINTGRTIVRGEPLQNGEYHLVVHIWIVNSKGQFLIQKRSSCVKLWPDMWAMTGGSVLAGENSANACQREMLEEIGIKADMSKAEKLFTDTRRDNFCDIWLLRQDFNLSQCTLQAEEVSDVKWASIEEIKLMAAEGTFVNYSYLEDLRNYI